MLLTFSLSLLKAESVLSPRTPVGSTIAIRSAQMLRVLSRCVQRVATIVALPDWSTSIDAQIETLARTSTALHIKLTPFAMQLLLLFHVQFSIRWINPLLHHLSWMLTDIWISTTKLCTALSQWDTYQILVCLRVGYHIICQHESGSWNGQHVGGQAEQEQQTETEFHSVAFGSDFCCDWCLLSDVSPVYIAELSASWL